MYISYSADKVTQKVTIVHSENKDDINTKLISPSVLKNSCGFDVFHIDSNKQGEPITAQDINLAVAKHLWEQFADTPVIDEDEDGCIEECIDSPFFCFETRTNVYEIWHWFESEFNLSIGKDLK